MAADETARDIGRRRRTSDDRLVGEVAAEIGRELGDRGVAPVRVRLDGLEGDPVKIATEAAQKTLGSVDRSLEVCSSFSDSMVLSRWLGRIAVLSRTLSWDSKLLFFGAWNGASPVSRT